MKTSIILLLLLITVAKTLGQVEGNIVYLGLFPASKSTRDNYMFHDYLPLVNNLTAYKYDGKKERLSLSDTFQVVGVWMGEYNNIKGNWIELNKRSNQLYDGIAYYLPLQPDKITDVTFARRNRFKKAATIFITTHLFYLALACIPFLLLAWWVRYKEAQVAKAVSKLYQG